MDLHSTMVRFIIVNPHFVNLGYQDLHSTMVRFIITFSSFEFKLNKRFTFHYG